jgi:SAM-dependent methyltransferase
MHSPTFKGFDEQAYLEMNPDVAAAVATGAFGSGAEHYALCGKNEGRLIAKNARAAPRDMPFAESICPSRRDKILSGLDLSAAEGLEIGALASPMVTEEEGNIFFVDHVGTHQLKEKYGNDPSVNVSNIVNVDAVWGSQTLQECIGSDKKVDYVVASHVIEHVPDLITWLAEIHSILKPSGSLRLAIPDRRYTFDYLRPESCIHDVLDAYLKGARAPLPRTILEHFSLIRHVDAHAAWSGPLDPAQLRPHASTSIGIEFAKDHIANNTYHDCHCWVFTPSSFSGLCIEMADLDLLKFSCQRHIDTAHNELEFYVHMQPCEDKAEILDSWRNMKKSLETSASNTNINLQKTAANFLEKTRSKFIGVKSSLAALDSGSVSTNPKVGNSIEVNTGPSSKSILDEYVRTHPSDQNILDMFEGEWSSAMPVASGLKTLPGTAALFEDSRIDWASGFFGGYSGKDILELGPLEGGHSYMIQKAGAKSVTSIESNRRAFQKCLCVKEVFNLDRVQFKLGDFNEYLKYPSRHFDAVIASGVLYHMTDPVTSLINMTKVSDQIFLWTHYYDQKILNSGAQTRTHFVEPHAVIVNDFNGTGARRYYQSSLEWNGFCGGSEPHAVWLSKDTILAVLKNQGFIKIDVGFDHPDHPNGPAFAVCAQR